MVLENNKIAKTKKDIYKNIIAMILTVATCYYNNNYFFSDGWNHCDYSIALSNNIHNHH